MLYITDSFNFYTEIGRLKVTVVSEVFLEKIAELVSCSGIVLNNISHHDVSRQLKELLPILPDQNHLGTITLRKEELVIVVRLNYGRFEFSLVTLS